MGTSQVAYALVTFFVIFLGIILFFIDGMLLWAITFFIVGLVLIIFKVMWGVAGWADEFFTQIIKIQFLSLRLRTVL